MAWFVWGYRLGGAQVGMTNAGFSVAGAITCAFIPFILWRAGAMGGGMTTQSVRAAPSFALGGDTYNISGDMNTAKQIQAQRKQAARSATLRMAWG